MPGRMDAAQASPMSAWMAVSREQNDHPLMLGLMNELDADKLDWVRSLPAGPPAKDGLARIVDADGGHDDAENSYETAAHPTFVQIEAARRRFRGQYLRRLKRLAEHARSSGIWSTRTPASWPL
jgi:hypothetical protein